jgi:predicted DNA-binding transcriptional regulator AlpA
VTTPTITATVPRLALRREEASAAIGVSPDHFDAHIRHGLRAVRRGRVVVYPVSEIEAWLEKNAARTLEDA